MVIQHNIMALNAYRNYANNSSALAGNLEKLSSGYKINRAGDDAAGLAISEKMRAQIAGLDAASKNVKDGISLVKTAEGAMQEVQDMLNRMVTLATQSANGTYADEVDREAIQAEIDQLNSEINRIADSANFNGIKLLDGSLDKAAVTGVNYTAKSAEDIMGILPEMTGTIQGDIEDANIGKVGILETESGTPASKNSFQISLDGVSVVAGEDDEFTLSIGEDVELTATLSAGNYSGATLAKALADENKTVTLNGVDYSVSTSGNVLKFVSTSADDAKLNTSAKVTWSVESGSASSSLIAPHLSADGYKEDNSEKVSLAVTNANPYGISSSDLSAIGSYSVAGQSLTLTLSSLNAGDDVDSVASALQTALNGEVSNINTALEAAAGTNTGDTYNKIDANSFTVTAKDDGTGFEVSYTTTKMEYNGSWAETSDTSEKGVAADGSDIDITASISSSALSALNNAGDDGDGKIKVGDVEIDLANALSGVSGGDSITAVTGAIDTAVAAAASSATDDAKAADTDAEGFTGYEVSGTTAVAVSDSGITINLQKVTMVPGEEEEEPKTESVPGTKMEIAETFDPTDSSAQISQDVIDAISALGTEVKVNADITIDFTAIAGQLSTSSTGADVADAILTAAKTAMNAWNTANPDEPQYSNPRVSTSADPDDKDSVVAHAGTTTLYVHMDREADNTPSIEGVNKGTINTGLQNVTTYSAGSSAHLAHAGVDFGELGAWQDGAKITIGNETYTVAVGDDSVFKDVSNAIHLTSADLAGGDEIGTVAARKLTEVAANNSIFTVGHDGNGVTVLQQRSTAKDSTDMTTEEKFASYLGVSTPDSLDGAVAGKGLTLQIGDTSDSYNQLTVSIGDIHADALGVGSINVSTQAGAQSAIDVIKNAINSVSSIRGALGATQNRLEHTSNNLSIMAENIQDAESTIRDTDVAEEMMSYVKNNILVQSAQAMLAQANQVPQGVLQLLG